MLALALLACTPDWEEVKATGQAVVDARQPEIDARLKQLEAARELSLSQAEPKPLDLGDRPAILWPGGPMGQQPNALVSSPEDIAQTNVFEDLSPMGTRSYPLKDIRTIQDGYVSSFCDGDSLENTQVQVQQVLERFLSPRYLVLIHATSTTEPQVLELTLGSDAPSMGTFMPGAASGWVRVFDLSEGGADLGGLRIGASNSESVRPVDFEGDLRLQLVKVAREAIEEQGRK